MGRHDQSDESGFVQSEIQRAAYDFQRSSNQGTIVVGMMICRQRGTRDPTLQIDAEIERTSAALTALRAKRDSSKPTQPLQLERRAAPTKTFSPDFAAVEPTPPSANLRRPPPRLRRIPRIRRI